MWQQNIVTLEAKPRGFHLITEEVLRQLPPLRSYKMGVFHAFIQHTSASLTINENADPTVRQDFESHMNAMVPENAAYYLHMFEGSDDMPAHIKASLLGNSITIPICDGRLGLGTWQGIYLGEHRNHGGKRKIIITIHGQSDGEVW
jgi:secondary thiamine-phosphate synthase enzyme